jgi:hypothetical protein
LGDLAIDEGIILKRILYKKGVKVWTGFEWLTMVLSVNERIILKRILNKKGVKMWTHSISSVWYPV